MNAENLDFPSLTFTLVSEKAISQNVKEILDIFMEKYMTCGSPEDIQNIVNFYIEHIAGSSLEDDDKECLIAAIVIASESPFYMLEAETK